MAAAIDSEVEAEVGFAGDADLAADQPVDDGVEVDGAGLESAGCGELDGKGDFILVAEVHERAQGEAAGDGELHGAGGDSVGKGPGDFRGLAGVACVDPVDVPVLLEREDEADLKGSAGGDVWREGDEFGGEVLGFDGAGAAVSYDLELGAGRRMKDQGAGEEQRGDGPDDIHSCQL